MLRYDLHTHTDRSKCGNMRPETLLKVAKKKRLDGIAVTDHGSIEGAVEVRRLNKDKNFEVIVGTEISTTSGDVLAYYLNKDIKSIDFFEMVDEVKKQGGLIVIPHPFRTSTNPMHTFKLSFEKIKNRIDAIECLNARMLFTWNNKKAERVANKLKMAKTAGGDAHFKFEVGTAYTMFEDNLRTALKNRDTMIGGSILLGGFGGALSFLRKRML